MEIETYFHKMYEYSVKKRNQTFNKHPIIRSYKLVSFNNYDISLCSITNMLHISNINIIFCQQFLGNIVLLESRYIIIMTYVFTVKVPPLINNNSRVTSS